jgi:rhomboid protease GluP
MFLLLIAANVLVYLAMSIAFSGFEFTSEQLLRWGGNLGELSLHGQPWRLLSATFLHAGFQHITGNMLLLGITGPYVEAKLGSVAILPCFLLCGLAGSLASAAGHPDVVGVGASGAIAGLLGVMLALWLTGKGLEVRGRWLAQVIGFNALYSLAPEVDWLAHLAGFGAGMLIGFVLPAAMRERFASGE